MPDEARMIYRTNKITVTHNAKSRDNGEVLCLQL